MKKIELTKQTKLFISHVRRNYDPAKPVVFWVDLFCGAGGTSTGIHLANAKNVFVAACVNHDANAIKSHSQNHPFTLHFTEDIRDFAVVENLLYLVGQLRQNFSGCKLKIWASLECTNFSKAKGGQARNADSRTLADHMPMYMALDPDVFWFENVIEFMAWGPLDVNGKPVSKNNGRDYIKWIQTIKNFGYKYDHKVLNAADFGAYQSRERLFLQFPKNGMSFAWPEKTHTKNPLKEPGLFDNPLQKWKAVKEVLNLQKSGVSIFGRKKDLVENTLKRIYAGLVKFVANGDDSFIKKYYSGRPEGKVISVNGPAGTVTTVGGQGIVSCDFILKYNSTSQNGKHVPPGVDEPCPTVACQNRLGLVSANFLQSYYKNGGAHDENKPCPTVTTVDRFGVVNYLMLNYTSGGFIKSVDGPAGAVLNNDKHNLVSAEQWLMPTSFNRKGNSVDEPCPTVLAGRKHHYIVNPSYGGHSSSIDKPSPTIIARQDKSPLGLIICEMGDGFIIPVYEDDSPTMILIKQFMAYYGIVDIKMRMLDVEELLQIQGFPKDYKLVGTQTEQKKYIGNAVEVNMAKALAFADYEYELKLAV